MCSSDLFPSYDTSVNVDTGDGPDPSSYYSILNRGKRHDYFTSCLPWPQKGPSVSLPLGSSADVKWRSAPGNTPTMRYTGGGIAPAGALSALAGGGIQSAGAPGECCWESYCSRYFVHCGRRLFCEFRFSWSFYWL